MGAEYAIYIEDYVLSYLKREVDSLELSEIFFYGKRESGGKKFLVYGAGRKKDIASFADYELLEELVCRLTQAGPVFMVREKSGEYRVTGFRTFYADNAAMQNYLIEWTGSKGDHMIVAGPKGKRIKQAAGEEVRKANTSDDAERKSGQSNAMSAQLCLILVVLVAIVVSSANSYDKMQRLNQSAKEIFFAMENQEAGQESGKNDVSEKPLVEDAAEREEETEKGTEVLVERDRGSEDISVEDAVRAENAEKVQNENNALEEDALQTEDVLRAEEEKPVEEDASEEALSRNITRYYRVERGDTLYTISQKIYGDTSRVEKICEVNEIPDPDKIHEGQKIILP